MQGVTLPYKVKSFIRLNHQLLVRSSEILGFDGDLLLLLKLDVAACSNYDSVLTRVMLFTAFLVGFNQLFFQFQVF